MEGYTAILDSDKKTAEEMDDGNRPYKFTLASTGEVFILGFFPQPGISMVFPNLDDFREFVETGERAVELFGPKVIKEASEILREKQKGDDEPTNGTIRAA